MRYLRLPIFALFTLIAGRGLAQDTSSKDSANAERTHFVLGVTANTGINYYGRVDSLRSKATIPFAGIVFRNGLYLNGNFVFIHNNLQSQYAATLLEGGYAFRDSHGHWSGNLSVSQFFYQQDISLVQSAVKEMAAVSLTYLNSILNVTLAANAKFSDNTDLGVQMGIDHIVRIPHILGKGVLVLDPAANCYAGTQNFIQVYFQKRSFLFLPMQEQEVDSSSRKFTTLSYELALPVVLGYGKFNFILSPAYVVPQHLLTVPGHPELSEYGGDRFYLTASVKVTF